MRSAGPSRGAQGDRAARTPHRVVVIGSGSGGLFATKALCRVPVEVTVVARTTHHLFQPLIYQVATGILSEGEIARPSASCSAGFPATAMYSSLAT